MPGGVDYYPSLLSSEFYWSATHCQLLAQGHVRKGILGKMMLENQNQQKYTNKDATKK